MGLHQSKDEKLYLAVQNGNIREIRDLRRLGASLEWGDNRGRTPLMLACSDQGLYDVAATLLQLGADVKAYRTGPEGGNALHHAVRKGLERHVSLLFSYGAEVMVMNDAGLTPLDLARQRGQLGIVRMLEARVSLFSGAMRQQTISGPGFLEVIAANWVFRKVCVPHPCQFLCLAIYSMQYYSSTWCYSPECCCQCSALLNHLLYSGSEANSAAAPSSWVVVLPCEVDPRRLPNPRRPPRYQLCIYQSPKVTMPSAIVPLETADISIQRAGSQAPILILNDNANNKKFKLLADDGNHALQVQQLFDACRGAPQAAQPPFITGPHWAPPPFTRLPAGIQPGQLPTDGGSMGHAGTDEQQDLALQMSISESLRTARDQGGNSASGEGGYGGWDAQGDEGSYGGWGPSGSESVPAGSGPPEQALSSGRVPSQLSSGAVGGSPAATGEVLPSPGAAEAQAPSAPPLPTLLGPDGAGIHYPSVDATPVSIDYNGADPAVPAGPAPEAGATAGASSKGSGGKDGARQCVICWDAPAQAVCIPCGHLVGCLECLGEVKEKGWGCPVCRTPIKEVMKVYQV